MYLINNLNESRFTLNGIQYLKNYISKVVENRIMIFNCYDNKDVLIGLTNFTDIMLNGSTYNSAADLQADLISAIYMRTTLEEGSVFYQNNTGRSVFIGTIPGIDVFSEIPDAINRLSLTVTATEAVILLWAYQFTDSGTKKLQFLFNGGKGQWGAAGTPVQYSQLIQLATVQPVISDIENDSDAVIIPLGEIANGNFLSAANSEEHDFSDSGDITETGIKTYYFSYILSGENENLSVLCFVLFTGMPGIYGAENSAFEESDFAITTNSSFQPIAIPSFEETMEQDNMSRYPAIIYDPENNIKTVYGKNYIKHLGQSYAITEQFEQPVADVVYKKPAKPENDTYAMLSDLSGYVTELPQDFFAATSTNSGIPNSIYYKTDIFRTLNIENFVPFTIYDSREIVRNENDLFIVLRSTETLNPSYVLALYNCRIINNILTVKDTNYISLDTGTNLAGTAKYNIHNSIYYKGNVYLSNRPDENNGQNKLFRINAKNLFDNDVLNFPISDSTNGNIMGLIPIKDKLIISFKETSASDDTNFGSVTIDLSEYMELFSYTDTMSRRISNTQPFIIYNNLIYLFTYNSTTTILARDYIGIIKLDLQGNILAQNLDQNFSFGMSTQPRPWWVNVFNGKILLITTGSGNSRIFRFNTDNLDLEDTILLQSLPADDASLFSNGILHLTATGTLNSVYYNDFSTFQTISTGLNYASNGSIDYIHYNIEKSIINTSDILNDGSDGLSPYISESYVQSVIETKANVDDVENLQIAVDTLLTDISSKLNKTITTIETSISFNHPHIYNSSSSPATGDITDNLLNAEIGVIQKIYHNQSSVPQFPATWVLMGPETYQTDQLNIIYAEWAGGSRVEYWIIHEN